MQYGVRFHCKFMSTKFLKIVSTAAIPNYPDRHLPTVLIYRNGEMLGQLVGIANLGGRSMEADGTSMECSRTS